MNDNFKRHNSTFINNNQTAYLKRKALKTRILNQQFEIEELKKRVSKLEDLILNKG